MLISIITVSLNDVEGLKKTVSSVREQKKYVPEIEYIVIDGNSSDGTNEYIHSLPKEIINYYVSENDNGIYDAMNKGISIANGDGLLFLNAGDYFVGNVITSDLKIPCFLKVKYINIFKKLVDRPIRHHKNGLPNCHQGIIFENRNIKYHTNYKICADMDYYLRHGYKNLQFAGGDGYVFFDNGGISGRMIWERDMEGFKIKKKHFGIASAIIGTAPNVFKFILRKILRK